MALVRRVAEAQALRSVARAVVAVAKARQQTRGLKDIVAFLRELETGARPCLRSKIIVVGDSGVGKTSVVTAIRGGKSSTVSKKRSAAAAAASGDVAPGIEIDQYEFDAVFDEDDRKRRTVTVSTWDITNNDVYQATNQLFASERSVHVIVWDISKTLDEANLEYWLHCVTSVAPTSPIILVGTHIDAYEDTSRVNLILEQAAARFQKTFQTIQAIISVSCTTGYDVDRLRSVVEDIVKQQKYLKEKVPSSFFTLEEALIEVRKKRIPPIMMWNEYIALANICNPKDTVQIQRATEFLHNIGSIVYFNDPNSTVGKMIILDVQWIINCITALITAKLTKNGIIRTSELAAIWKSPSYPEHLQGALLAIMQAFEITYPLSPGDLVKSDDLVDPFASSSSLGGHHLNTTSTSSLSTLVSSINSSSTMSLASVMTTGSSIIGISPNTNAAGASNDRHLVPNLLAETGNIVSQWEDFNDPDVIRLNRQYHLPFIPDKFFGKLIIRLIHFVKVESCLKRAVIVKNAAGHEALIELKTNHPRDQSRKRVLTVDVRGLPTPVALLRIVTDTIESLLSQWYKLDIKRCISCYECTFLFDPNPTLFTIEDCELAVMDGKTVLNCFKKADEHEERTTHRLKLDILAPDIAMLDIPRPRFDLKEIKLLKEIGRGAFGVVYEAEWNGETVALKKLIPRTIDDQNSTDMSADEQKEDRLKVFREFRHEVGFCIQPLCMALEIVKYGSLYSLLSNPTIEVSWGLRLQIASEIAKGMQHLHSHNPSVIHRDLKSPNILMHATVEGPAPVSTIIDYGTSTALYGGAALARCVDQPLWLAPEVMASMAYSEPSDVYAFGIILWELYTRAHPYDEFQFGQWMSKLEDEIIRGLRPTIPTTCPPEYAELIQSCWTHEPNSRPTFTSVVETLTNLKKKFAPLQSTLPPHIRLATRKSRSSSFSESMLTGSITGGLNLTVSTGSTKDGGQSGSSNGSTPTGGSVLTTQSLVSSGQHPGQIAMQQQQTFANTSSSSLSSAAAGGSLHHSPSSSDLIDDIVSDEDLHSLDIYTEEELEQPYPFCDDDQQRGILFGFDEEQASSNSIVVAATLAKMIELMTRPEPIPSSILSQASNILSNMPAPGSMYSRSETQSSLSLSTASTSSMSSTSGMGSAGATGRKRSDTAGKNLPPPSFSSMSPTPQSSSSSSTSYRNSIPSLSVQSATSTLDENFIDDFLSVYRSFTTPTKVFKMLVRRFFGPRPNKSDAYTLKKFEQRRPQIRSGVSSFLKRWCNDITELEYKQDACWLYHKVFEFTNVCLVSEPPVANAIIGILASYENISKTLIEMELRIKNGMAPLHPSSSSSSASTTPVLGGASSQMQNISKTFLNLAIGIRDPLYGVPVREKKFKNKAVLWVKCFTGADCIDWLMKITSLPSREDAKTVAMDLHTRQFIYLLSEDGTVVADLKGGNKIEFYDSQTQYYTFLDDDTELVAQQYTFLELKFLQDIHPRELLGFSVGLATNDSDRLSEIERKIEYDAEKSATSQTSDDRDEREARHTDSLGFGNEELTERDWSLLLTSATVITYHRGDVVIEENTINSYLYRIKSGVLGVEKKNRDGKSVKVSSMNAPKMFGEMSFLGNKTTARVVVDETADLYVMDIPFLNSLFVSHPRLGAKFYKIMANQLASRLKNLPWSKPQSSPPANTPSSGTPPSTPPSMISPLVSALAGNSGAGSFGSMGGGPGSSAFLQPFAKEASPPPPLVVPSIALDRLNTSTPPASPRTPVAPNPFLANIHPHLQHRTNTVSNFNTSGLGGNNNNNNSSGSSGGGPLSHILTPRSRDEGARSGSVSRAPTQANLKYTASSDKSNDNTNKGGQQNEEKKTDQEFNQRFSLDEIVIKDYACSLNRSGRLYISQGHVCFYSKFFGYKTKKVIPFKQIQNLLCVNNTFLDLSRLKSSSQRNYRFTFTSTKDRQDAYGIINSLCESAKLATTSTADDLKIKLREERKKQHATLKPKNKSTADQLTKEDWELIGREGSRCTIYKKDEPIVRQGDRIQKIFQIGKGVCRIEKTVAVTQHNNPHVSSEWKTVVLGTMKQDETFGEITFLLSGEVTATVVADNHDVEIYAIEGQFVNILFDLNPSLATRCSAAAYRLALLLREKYNQSYNIFKFHYRFSKMTELQQQNDSLFVGGGEKSQQAPVLQHQQQQQQQNIIINPSHYHPNVIDDDLSSSSSNEEITDGEGSPLYVQHHHHHHHHRESILTVPSVPAQQKVASTGLLMAIDDILKETITFPSAAEATALALNSPFSSSSSMPLGSSATANRSSKCAHIVRNPITLVEEYSSSPTMLSQAYSTNSLSNENIFSLIKDIEDTMNLFNFDQAGGGDEEEEQEQIIRGDNNSSLYPMVEVVESQQPQTPLSAAASTIRVSGENNVQNNNNNNGLTNERSGRKLSISASSLPVNLIPPSNSVPSITMSASAPSLPQSVTSSSSSSTSTNIEQQQQQSPQKQQQQCIDSSNSTLETNKVDEKIITLSPTKYPSSIDLLAKEPKKKDRSGPESVQEEEEEEEEERIVVSPLSQSTPAISPSSKVHHPKEKEKSATSSIFDKFRSKKNRESKDKDKETVSSGESTTTTNMSSSSSHSSLSSISDSDEGHNHQQPGGKKEKKKDRRSWGLKRKKKENISSINHLVVETPPVKINQLGVNSSKQQQEEIYNSSSSNSNSDEHNDKNSNENNDNQPNNNNNNNSDNNNNNGQSNDSGNGSGGNDDNDKNNKNNNDGQTDIGDHHSDGKESTEESDSRKNSTSSETSPNSATPNNNALLVANNTNTSTSTTSTTTTSTTSSFADEQESSSSTTFNSMPILSSSVPVTSNPLAFLSMSDEGGADNLFRGGNSFSGTSILEASMDEDEDQMPRGGRGRSNAFYMKQPPTIVNGEVKLPPMPPFQSPLAAAGPFSNVLPKDSSSLLSKPTGIFGKFRKGHGRTKMANKVVKHHSSRFLVGFADTIGRRPTMEDDAVIYGSYRGHYDEDYFALFDGHGGAEAAELASTEMHRVLSDRLKKDSGNPVRALKESFNIVHGMIAERRMRGGTTAVIALFLGKKGYVANVGDSRAVLCRDGVTVRVSIDHKPNVPKEEERIKALGGNVVTTTNSVTGVVTSRVNGQLAVSRALGDSILSPYVSCEPDIHGPINLENQVKNQFMIIACDGLWDVVTDEEATAIVAPISDPEKACMRLRDQAFTRGSTDNISVMVVRFPPFSPTPDTTT
ncbi:RasGEF domain-containing protein [Cavenderia fasciculata]|uniref:non-specific serine/threonine protein kinase n=1 Tax=Cavenderia fasciculata TaxID=261658 RepID=F4PHM9_CACFS|nr:RasGEF domain-containing protein [Cavenderia fasciculata]EGG25213.1 RasGEF domain-containing protein [Cavenderia fasciculata]|eukprot:XP_004363064.1 RasGEF domain-containing protein [Cavenderia fasciculata]